MIILSIYLLTGLFICAIIRIFGGETLPILAYLLLILLWPFVFVVLLLDFILKRIGDFLNIHI